ncbi:MAG: DM13 domain-containing protein [Candidatus Magasanikbacteria bacterium]|jgi:hypothetical protein|nr:DM13 domain-containing protein [Candidatus Magasanikbacteria bacterium]MBT4221095.1 DM13 domain-containing protein [Candidatus Magasanikbacteria bacterium]MBT4350561.1 DM13 domain-containing protein [Candidatus Magasanikbacteria bacterium]MBT4542140.1 DM13 domain-containing protein [Candidatus Magasanikbacteria bacterium]MBT6253262.1 DM13 domain-containing protein [Candidatus Magasanikbacteria bacterium]
MKKVLGLIVLLIVIGIGYWLISPLFIDKEVVEVFDPKTEAAIQQAISDFKENTTDTNIDDQMPEEEQEELFKEMAKAEDVVVTEPMPVSPVTEGEEPTLEPPGEDAKDLIPEPEVVEAPVVVPKVLSVGSFVDVAHHGSGEAKIINLGEGKGNVLRFENFNVSNGPDLRVLFSKNESITKSSELGEYIELGKLKGNIGSQNYILEEGLNLEEYKTVVIYCKPFRVVFNTATIK